jgi:uncharacterized protein
VRKPITVPTRRIELGAHSMFVHEFGSSDAPLRIHLQAGLHADEAPGCVVLYHLADELAKLQSQGLVQARITLLPAANPIGATQYLMGGLHCGRFDLISGVNFNRNFPDLRSVAIDALGQITPVDHQRLPAIKYGVRQHLLRSLAHWPCTSELDKWRVALLELACAADWVLDLHCDQEAVTHLYTAPQLWNSFQDLAAYLNSEVQLIDGTAAKRDGHGAFDTACFQPWLALSEHLGTSQEWGCHAATVELRGQGDVTQELVHHDVTALLNWLQSLGAIVGQAKQIRGKVPAPRPLEGVESVYAPCSGIFVPEAALGASVIAGQLLGTVYDLQSHRRHLLHSSHNGTVFARTRSRAVYQGAELVKIAGQHATRNGPLLSM